MQEEEEAVDHSSAASDEIKVSEIKMAKKKRRYHRETQGAVLSIVSDIYVCDCGEVRVTNWWR